MRLHFVSLKIYHTHAHCTFQKNGITSAHHNLLSHIKTHNLLMNITNHSLTWLSLPQGKIGMLDMKLDSHNHPCHNSRACCLGHHHIFCLLVSYGNCQPDKLYKPVVIWHHNHLHHYHTYSRQNTNYHVHKVTTGSSRHMRISLPRFFKTFQKYLAYTFFGLFISLLRYFLQK